MVATRNTSRSVTSNRFAVHAISRNIDGEFDITFDVENSIRTRTHGDWNRPVCDSFEAFLFGVRRVDEQIRLQSGAG